MDKSYQKLIKGNQIFADTKLFQDPNYFTKLSAGQRPDYLWIGCSDSRVPANEITNTQSGEIFVHRNIANLVIHTDTNLLSVLEYAVKYIKVKHIIVCGHYGCGGVMAAMSNTHHGYVDNWLRNIKDTYHKNEAELGAIADMVERGNRLSELSVVEQVRNLAKTNIVQEAWAERDLHLHGWVYGLTNGIIKDLAVIHNNKEDINDIYRFKIEKSVPEPVTANEPLQPLNGIAPKPKNQKVGKEA
ncbi:MAG: carbonic anhydrase [Bacteroidota bacterium]